MRLRLLLKGPARLMGADLERILETGSLVIGRSPEADWTIADPDRVISKAHCRIDRTDSGFAVFDTSTNGLRINDRLLGRGMPGVLSHGDTLLLGDAVIAAELIAQAAGMVTMPVVALQPPGGAADPFMEGPFGFDEGGQTPAAVDKPVATETGALGGKGQILQDWWNPTAASDKPAEPLSVDISTQAANASLAHTNGVSESLASGGGDVQSLMKAADGVDAKTFARAVDMAVQVLSEGERQKFEGRLRDILREEIARWK